MASSDDRPPGPPAADRLPTLTEVLELPPAPTHIADLPGRGGWYLNGGVVGAWSAPANSVAPGWAGTTTPAGPDVSGQPSGFPVPCVDAPALVAQVLQALAPRIDQLFEAHAREAVAPALARAADALVRDARADLTAALQRLVEQAVAQVLRPGAGP